MTNARHNPTNFASWQDIIRKGSETTKSLRLLLIDKYNESPDEPMKDGSKFIEHNGYQLRLRVVVTAKRISLSVADESVSDAYACLQREELKVREAAKAQKQFAQADSAGISAISTRGKISARGVARGG